MSGTPADIAGIVLAGGRATRLGGGDKPLRPIGGRPMLALILERLTPQVGPIAVSANDDPARFSEFGLPVLPDEGARAGPLSGVLSGLAWAKAAPGRRTLLTVAGDTPFFPLDLAARLAKAVEGRPSHVAVAASLGRLHPVFALWPVSLEADLREFLAEGGPFSVTAFLERVQTVGVDFPTASVGGATIDPFFNINLPEDLAKAEAIVKGEYP